MNQRPSNVSIRIFAVVLALWLGIAGVIVPLRDLVPVASAANCLTFSPVADTYVDSGIPRKNFGSSLQLVADGSPASELYLKFEITELSGAVTSAMLRLYVKNASKSGGAVARMSNTSWSEMAVTYDDRPAIDGPDLSSLSAVKVGEWVEFDVLGALTGNGMLGLGIYSTSRDGVDYGSREDGANAPQLVVTTDATSEPAPTAPDPTVPDTTTPDTTPPSVALTSPASATSYTSAQTVQLVASESDNVGVTRIEFYDNGVLQGSEDSSPYAYSWSISNSDNGLHRWTATAFDAAGNSTTSNAVELTVDIAPSDGGEPSTTTTTITATVETDPVPNSGDAADDPAVWVHPTDSSMSTIIGTDKLGGLAVYDLAGNQLHYYADLHPNNVDVRYNFPLGSQQVDLVTASDRESDSIFVFLVNPSTRALENIAARTISSDIGVAGLCMYRSNQSGSYYVFIGDSSGNIEQWRLFESSGMVDAERVRTLDLESTTEGCVVDDEMGQLYVAEEDVAIWKYGAEPEDGETRTAVDTVDGSGHLSADIEGLALYYAGNGAGYLIASSQGSNNFVIYERGGNNPYVTSFTVSAGPIDGVSYTDGLDVSSAALGSAFPEGMFVAQDDSNDSGNQNFKLVPWGSIARSVTPPLTIDTSVDPRQGASVAEPVMNIPSDTLIDSGPSGTVDSTSATFTFISTGVELTFACSLDGAVVSACTSPTEYTNLANGSHTFQVGVMDVAGNIDPTPASRTWTVATTPVIGTTYYADSVNGRDSNTGTSEAFAWKTLSKASGAMFAPGDQLLLKRGSSWTSTLSVTESGTSDAPIVVDAYGIGDHPIIQHKSNGVMLSGSYIIVRNIHVNNHSWSGVYISGSFNRIENSLVTNNVAGIYVKSGAACNGIVGNVIKDNNKMSVLTRRSGDDSGAFGVLIHGDFTEVAYNTISGSDAFSYDFDLDGAAVEIYGGQNNDIHHNLAIDNHAFTELGHPRSANNTFAYNVVRSSLDTSTFLVTRGAGSRYGPVMTTRVLNNSVYMTGNGSQGFVCHAGCGSDILMMRNNIIQAVAKTGFADAPFDEDYNLYHGGQHQFTMGSHSVVTDPMFVDPVAGDLHLQSTSPAIDAGAHLGYTIDIDGQSVALDGNCDGTASPDFGAYEYVCTD